MIRQQPSSYEQPPVGLHSELPLCATVSEVEKDDFTATGSNEVDRQLRAKRLCGRCALQVTCLERGLSDPAVMSDPAIYGGLTLRERQTVRRVAWRRRRQIRHDS